MASIFAHMKPSPSVGILSWKAYGSFSVVSVVHEFASKSLQGSLRITTSTLWPRRLYEEVVRCFAVIEVELFYLHSTFFSSLKAFWKAGHLPLPVTWLLLMSFLSRHSRHFGSRTQDFAVCPLAPHLIHRSDKSTAFLHALAVSPNSMHL